MKIGVEQQGEVTVIRIEGKLGFAERDPLQTELAKKIDEGNKRLVVDLSNVNFVSSDGLAALIAVHKHAHGAGGWMRIVCDNACPYHVFQKTRLVDLFDIRRSLDCALGDEPRS